MYENYKKLRDERGLNDYQFSKATGIPLSSLYDWKHKRTSPSIKNAKIISDFFGVSIDELVRGEA